MPQTTSHLFSRRSLTLKFFYRFLNRFYSASGIILPASVCICFPGIYRRGIFAAYTYRASLTGIQVKAKIFL